MNQAATGADKSLPSAQTNVASPWRARFKDRTKWPRKWWWPPPEELNLSKSDWKKQHDEISKAINKLLIILISFCFFCALTLAQSDVSLLPNHALTLPFANLNIRFDFFLYIGPIMLSALSIYLHIFVEYWVTLSTQQPSPSSYDQSHAPALPFVFNLKYWIAIFLSEVLFYGLVPVMLTFFTWKALPRPGGPILPALTSAFVIVLVFLSIRRAHLLQRNDFSLLNVSTCAAVPRGSQETNTYWKQLRFGLLWLCLLLGVFFFIWILVGKRWSRPLDLAGADLKQQALQSLDLTHARLDGADLHGMSLNQTNLSNADLRYANLSDADLSQVKDLRYANLSGANLIDANLSRVFLGGVNLNGANLNHANLNGANLSGAIIFYTKMSGVNLNDANLGNVPLSRLDLKGASLIGAFGLNKQLFHADLRGANLSHQDLSGANVFDTNLNSADLSYANLSNTALGRAADLREANLSGAILNETNLSFLDLNGVNLSGTNLSQQDLSHTNLSGSNLKEAILNGANLSEAKGLTQLQVNVALGNYQTKLPATISMPKSWFK